MQLTTKSTTRTTSPGTLHPTLQVDLMVPSKVRGAISSNTNAPITSTTMSAASNNDPVELRMSVTSIKRVDPYVKDILAKSTHVALYRFNPPQNEWEKTETEGALFLYSRSGEPLHSIMIMNRLNTNNLIEPIVKEFEYQLQAPFLLYRNSKNKIFGIWFYNREECVNITIILESLMDGLKEKNKQVSISTDDKDNSSSVDIFSMLSRAQEDYNKTPIKNSEDMQHRFSSTPRAPPDVTSQSVMDFFAKAGVKGSSSVPKNVSSATLVQTQSVQPQVVHTPEGNNILQRLMSNPAHSVEHIEKQQRSVTPKQQDPQLVILRKNTNDNVKKSLPVNIINYSNSHKGTSNDNGFNFIRLQSPSSLQQQQNVAGSSPLAQFLKQTPLTPLSSSNVLGSSSGAREVSPLALLLESPQKQPLMPPMMFATSSSRIEDEMRRSSPNELTEVEPLTKNQLIQAMNYLLTHDSEFVTKLHEAYVKSLTEKMAVPMRGADRHCNNNPTSLI